MKATSNWTQKPASEAQTGYINLYLAKKGTQAINQRTTNNARRVRQSQQIQESKNWQEIRHREINQLICRGTETNWHTH